jgi:predicted nucleic acid-binding protein
MPRPKKSTPEASVKNEIVKDKIREYLADSWQEMINDIKDLDPKDRVDRRLKLMEYVMPKVQAVRDEKSNDRISMAAKVLGMEAAYDDNYIEDEDEAQIEDT